MLLQGTTDNNADKNCSKQEDVRYPIDDLIDCKTTSSNNVNREPSSFIRKIKLNFALV
jgi:hypothetical protein